MADESNTPDVPPTPQPAEPAAAVSPPAPASKPASRPQEQRKPQRGGGGGGGGDRPRKRVRDSVPSLDDHDFRNRINPNVRDLDAEIAAELEATLKGMDDKSFYAADTSERARSQAAAQGEHGRKIGKVISIHAPDIFIEIPGGRSQGVLTMEHFPEGLPKVGDQVEIGDRNKHGGPLR